MSRHVSGVQGGRNIVVAQRIFFVKGLNRSHTQTDTVRPIVSAMRVRMLAVMVGKRLDSSVSVDSSAGV